MPFRFEWRDQSQRAMCYVAEGDWNWKDYHQAVRASAFTLMSAEQSVDSVIDLRGSTRNNLPAGALAHVRSFGRITQARLSGRAAVIGIPAAECGKPAAAFGRQLGNCRRLCQIRRERGRVGVIAGGVGCDPARCLDIFMPHWGRGRQGQNKRQRKQ